MSQQKRVFHVFHVIYLTARMLRMPTMWNLTVAHFVPHAHTQIQYRSKLPTFMDELLKFRMKMVTNSCHSLSWMSRLQGCINLLAYGWRRKLRHVTMLKPTGQEILKIPITPHKIGLKGGFPWYLGSVSAHCIYKVTYSDLFSVGRNFRAQREICTCLERTFQTLY